MVLPIFRPVAMRTSLSNERYSTIESTLLSEIESESSKSPFDATSARRFLDAYFGDLAKEEIDLHVKSNTVFSTKTSRRLTDSALLLLQRLLAESPGAGNTALLLDAIIACNQSQDPTLQDISSSSLSQSTATDIISSLHSATQASFGTKLTPLQTLDSLVRVTYVWKAVLQTQGPALMEAFVSPNNQQWVGMWVQIYDIVLPSIRESLPGSINHADWAENWFKVKIALLDSLHSVFTFLTSHSSRINSLCDFAFLLTEKSSSSSGGKVLLDTLMLQDYQKLFKFSEELERLGKDIDDGRVEVLASTFVSAAEGVRPDKEAIRHLLPSVDLEKTPLAKPIELPTDTKGKGRATEPEQDDSQIEFSISHILDILPDQDPSFLRRCLQHSTYQGEGGTEKLISHLLEGNVPIDLSVEEHAPQANSSTRVDEMEFVKNRRNVFDDQIIDMSSLRLGKKKDTAEGMLEDKGWLQEMKAEILRRAQANSDEEEEETAPYGRDRKRFVPLEEDEFDDDLEGNVSVVGDGEVDSGDDDVPDSGKVEAILELAYIENPKLFDRESKKSKARADLRAKTGWADEQIEGWRIMLERNPKKDKILSKHEFRGNKSLQVEHQPKSGRESPAGRGRGGDRGRGRGRGRGGHTGNDPSASTTTEGQTNSSREGGRGSSSRGGGRGGGERDEARERAFKERNKNRARQRGHDKKMARGGGPA